VIGTISSVHVLPGPKARVMMSVQERFSPFRANASCSILPEGLISENYVECNPGSSGGPLPVSDGIATVPLQHTSVPFSLQDVLNVFSVPTDARLQVLISELGIATSGRGQDINALLRRADPTLTQARRALAIVDAQRVQAAAAVSQTNEVLAGLAQESGQVRRFVDTAATVVQTTAAHPTALQASIARLPAMLAAVKPGLRSLIRVATNASPLLTDLHAAAPGLTALTGTLPAFAAAGEPAVKRLAKATRQGIPTLKATAPVTQGLATATTQLAPFANQIDAMLVSLRQTGGIEGTLRLMYTLAVLGSEEDSVSHLINFTATVAPQCLAAENLGGLGIQNCYHTYSSADHDTVPINEPSCGPQKPIDMWEDHYCPVPTPEGLPTLNRSATSNATSGSAPVIGGPLDRSQAKGLLNYLLKP
jgi:ABC-type transporter Mla subunit MlaD